MIGLFDSGSGGLTVLSAIKKKAPLADIVYFGDIAHAPYGEKSEKELASLTKKGIEILRRNGVDALVSACNSISTLILQGAAGQIPVIEMSKPTAYHAQLYRGKRLLLLATVATIDSGLYQQALENIVTLDTLAIPRLAAAIEFNKPQEEIRTIIKEALQMKSQEKYDALLLGCTHYPLVSETIEEIAKDYFGELPIIDPAYPVADAVCSTLDLSGKGSMRFLISQESEIFHKRVKNLFPTSTYTIEVVDR